MVEIVNVVASGALGLELDLDAVSQELDDIAEYDSKKYPGVYVRFDESQPLVTLYRTGKYIITGSNSENEACLIRDEFLRALADHGIITDVDDEWFSIQNYVCVSDAGQQLNLSALAIGLGLEATEYEPEQFPGLVYRPQDHNCVLLAFGSGKIIITGAESVGGAEDAVQDLFQQIDDLL